MAERWSKTQGEFLEIPRIDAFLEDVIAVCKKHGLSIEHEDNHGSFIVTEYYEPSSDWLREAVECFTERRKTKSIPT